MWTLHLLGALRATSGEKTLERFRTHKTGSLLAYLAFHLGKPIPREVLSDLCWPDDGEEVGRRKLTVALSWLRQRLEEGLPEGSVLVADRAHIRLNPAQVQTDVAAMDTHLREARSVSDAATRERHLTRVVEMYRPELVTGHYEDWIAPAQQQLETAYFSAVRELITLKVEAKDSQSALHYASLAAAIDPLRDENQQHILRLLVDLGRPTEALRHYRQYEELLWDALQTRPSAETRAWAERVKRLLQGEGATQRPAPPLDAELVGSEASAATPDLEQWGAVPLGSPYYVKREVDDQLIQALGQRVSVVLIKGARQSGKSSLLARGLEWGRQHGVRVAHTDLGLVNEEQYRSADAFLRAVARMVVEELESSVEPAQVWDPEDGPSINFQRFMRRVVQEQPEAPLVWAMDNLEALFQCAFGRDVFSLIRSWHNARSLNPGGPWHRLTVVLSFAVEAHLLIPDSSQSPFNVGTSLHLGDFSAEALEELNRRYRQPLRGPAELREFRSLVGGHPYLVRRGLRELAQGGVTLAALRQRADLDDWIFGDHLRRLRAWLHARPALAHATDALLDGTALPTQDQFHALRSAGVLSGNHWQEARFRCDLYERSLRRDLESRR